MPAVPTATAADTVSADGGPAVVRPTIRDGAG